jgi:hypothetical protein
MKVAMCIHTEKYVLFMPQKSLWHTMYNADFLQHQRYDQLFKIDYFLSKIILKIITLTTAQVAGVGWFTT